LFPDADGVKPTYGVFCAGMSKLRVGIAGGGINGVMIAWLAARQGFQVELFERKTLMGATSSASSKLLHGGLRYLEHGHFRLVREGLRERAWWLKTAPHLARRLELVLPCYTDLPRSRIAIRAGLMLYDALAGPRALGHHRWLGRPELLRFAPRLKESKLRGGFLFYDGQMDDLALGLWAAEQARSAGATIHEKTAVDRVGRGGGAFIHGEWRRFDYFVNATGPWAKQLLDASAIPTRYELDLVRGSHVILPERVDRGYLLQPAAGSRICFVLPYQNSTLVGTTEVRQQLDEPVACSDAEANYLLSVYNRHFRDSRGLGEIQARFAGLRPLVRSHPDPSKVNRECALEKQGRLINVFGGKWTTSRALAQKACALIGEGG
jgi:glycerol-3-phosphate dehydrogenase